MALGQRCDLEVEDRLDIAVQFSLDLVGTQFTDFTADGHFAAIHFVSQSRQGFRNHESGHCTKNSTIFPGAHRQRYGQLTQLFGKIVGSLAQTFLTKFCLTNRFGPVVQSWTTGNHGKALRNQKIEPVTVADFDHVVFEAEAFNVLFENDLHIKMRLDA